MSEPMSSVEIEDVLSSIRRLVSDDLRPQARPQAAQPAAPAPQPAAAAADKLLLTPALRIVPEPEAVAEPEPAFHSVRNHVEEEARFIAVEDDEAEVASAVVTPLADYYEDEEAAPAVGAASVIPDAAFAEPEPQAEPQPGPVMAEAGPDLDWADAAEAAVRAELEEEVGAASYAHILDDAPEAAAALDEEALRDLVRDIIREELQGTLGERITRNVRKLVRAEVARALAVRDFE